MRACRRGQAGRPAGEAIAIMSGGFCDVPMSQPVSDHTTSREMMLTATLVASVATFVVCGLFLLLSILLGCDKRSSFSDWLRRLYSVSTFEHDVSLCVRRYHLHKDFFLPSFFFYALLRAVRRMRRTSCHSPVAREPPVSLGLERPLSQVPMPLASARKTKHGIVMFFCFLLVSPSLCRLLRR